jgi:trigger factor
VKLETQPRDDHQVKLIAEFESEALEKYMHQAARKIAKETKIPGFRPGKAPYDVIVRMFGTDNIQKEAIGMMVDDVYPDILKEADVKPGAPGDLEEIISMDPPKFSFVVPLEPTVDLGDYKSIQMEYSPEPVDQKEVDEFIDHLRKSYATATPVERPVQEGDLVFFNIHAKLTQPAEGEKEEVLKDMPGQTEVKPVADQPASEFPFPGFGWELIGASAGETRTIVHKFDDETPYSMLKGKEVVFEVQINEVKKQEYPELDDAFAQSVGEFDSMEKLTETVREQLDHNAKDHYDEKFFNDLMEKLAETAAIHYPPQILDQEIENVLDNLTRDLARQNMDMDTYLKVRKLEKEKFIEEEIKPAAIRRLERSLVMDQVARDEKIELQQDEITREFNSTFADLQQSSDFEEMRKRVKPADFANAIAMEAVSRLMNRRVFSRLKSIVTGQPEEVEVVSDQTPDAEAPAASAEEAAADEAAA